MVKITIFNGKIHYKWPFSIAMLVHQNISKVGHQKSSGPSWKFAILTIAPRIPRSGGRTTKHGQSYIRNVDGGNPNHQLVDGWKPIVIPWNLQCFIVPNSYQLVQDFFHPQYVCFFVGLPNKIYCLVFKHCWLENPLTNNSMETLENLTNIANWKIL